MTEVTPSELKMLYIEIVIVAVIGVFLLFYQASPIDQTASLQSSISNGTSYSTSSTPFWSTTLVDSTLGLPVGSSAILIVSSIVLIPMTIMNAFVLIRIGLDAAKGWI